MKSNVIEIEALDLLKNYFDLGSTEFKIGFEELKERLNFLLDHDFERLLNDLYRFDFDELQLREILAQNSRRPIAAELAEAILLHARKKVETRRLYRRS